MKNFFCFFALAALLACNHKSENKNPDIESELQQKLSHAKKGDVIEIPEGKFEFSSPLVLHSVPFVTIRGVSPAKTVLSFKNQNAEGAAFSFYDCSDLTLENLSVHDSKGDGVDARNSHTLVIRNVAVGWSSGPSKSNGENGIHVLLNKNITIEKCAVTAAAGAGIFISQSENIILRENLAFENGAGILVENCTYADVHNNKTYNNAGGIMIVELPGLPAKNGHHFRIFDNVIKNNNLPNLASDSDKVFMLPSGTGIFLLSTRDVEIFRNQIEDHRTLGAAIVSILLMGKKYSDEAYNPYSSSIFIHNNKFTQALTASDTITILGKMVDSLFHENAPQILFDGFIDPVFVNPDGKVREAGNLCLQNNGDIKFANLQASSKEPEILTDPLIHNCELGEIPPVE